MKPIAEIRYHNQCLRLFVAEIELAAEGEVGNPWDEGEGSEDGICWSPAGLRRVVRQINEGVRKIGRRVNELHEEQK